MKNRLLQITLILAILILGLTCKQPDADTTGNIQGTVKTINDVPIEGATVKINSSPNEQTAITKSDGTYAFNDLPPNNYQVIASKYGYTDNPQNITVIVGETKSLDFELSQYNPTFTVTSPTAGVNWTLNSTQNITWTSTGLTGNVKIELMKNAALSKTIETSTENDGTYPWLIPTDLISGTDYKVKITSLTEPTVFDESDFFALSTVSPNLSVSPSNQNVAMSAGNTTFNITSNTNWTATSNESWCTVTSSGTGNSVLTANFTENTSSSQRTATITISASGLANQTVTVTQSYVAPNLTVSPSNQNVAMTSGSTNFTVTSNTSWSATSNQTWCVVTTNGTGNGTLTAIYNENTSGSQRTATITVSANGVSNQIITVTQSYIAPSLSVTPSNQSVTLAAGSTTFTATSNTSWNVSSDQTWCTVNTSGTGNGTITATYTQNPANSQRIANITISANGVTNQIVTVTQSANTLINGLVAYYPFNGNANDESGNGNNGTVNGATLTTDRKGNTNSAFNFDGTSSYIIIQDFNISQNTVSYAFWVKSNSNQGVPIISKHGDITNVEVLISIQTDGKYDYEWTINDQYYDSGILTNYYAGNDGKGLALPSDNWDFIVITYSGSKMSFYLNNILINSGNASGAIADNIVPLYIGTYVNLIKFFNGKIDDIRIYNRALIETEILQLYNE